MVLRVKMQEHLLELLLDPIHLLVVVRAVVTMAEISVKQQSVIQ